MPIPRKDLLVLVADVKQEKVVEALLSVRRGALGLREVIFDIRVHPQRDPGVYRQAAAFVQPFRTGYGHALILVDEQWEGSPGAASIEAYITTQFRDAGWADDSYAVLVLAPELEAWAWRGADCLRPFLGVGQARVYELAATRGGWPEGALKPPQPKELLEDVLREAQKKPSSSVYAEIARHLSLRQCHDPAFQRLCEALRRWFPAGSD